jgi:hypothetical protein
LSRLIRFFFHCTSDKQEYKAVSEKPQTRTQMVSAKPQDACQELKDQMKPWQNGGKKDTPTSE